MHSSWVCFLWADRSQLLSILKYQTGIFLSTQDLQCAQFRASSTKDVTISALISQVVQTCLFIQSIFIAIFEVGPISNLYTSIIWHNDYNLVCVLVWKRQVQAKMCRHPQVMWTSSWSSPILSWPRNMFSKCVCYDFSTFVMNAVK